MKLTRIIAALGIAALVASLLQGCYTQQKAKNQFGKAAITYPEIPARYCATTYPAKEVLIKGKDSLLIDTIYTGTGEFITDTIVKNDTIFYHTVERLPGTVITKTIARVDTAYIENTAALALCDIERGKAIGLLDKKTIEADRWRAIAKKRFWIIVGLGLILMISFAWKIYKKMTVLKG